jgi:Type II secretory pathway, component PulF
MRLITKFTYVAYDKSGVRQQGELSAIDRESARFKVKERGLILLRIKRSDTAVSQFSEKFRFSPRPGLSDVEFMTAQLSLLLKNGVKIDHALLTVKAGIKNKKLKKAIDEIYEDIRRGTSLSDSLQRYSDIFDPLYISIVSIGETTGRLADVFESLAKDLNFRQGISSKTRQALIYPSLIFVVCLLAVVFIFDFIVPRLSVVFAGMENLPVYTNILLTGSALFRKYQFVGVFVVVGLVIFLPRIRKNDRFRRWRDALILKVPVVKQMCYSLENLRFTSSFAILLKNNVVITQALDYAIKSVGNVFIRKKLSIVKDEVRKGKKLSETMTRTGFLPDIFNNLIEVGEQTGNLAGIFSEMQKRLRNVYEMRVTSFVTLIEPIMIVFMGIIVGSVVVVMLLSIVSINDINF